MTEKKSPGHIRLEGILGVPLAEDAVRQWPQMGERVRTRPLINSVEGNFEAFTYEVGRRIKAENDHLVVEWSCNYGDGQMFRNVTIAEIKDGKAIRATDYWGPPFKTPAWRVSITERLDMPPDGIWKDAAHVKSH